MCSQPLKSEKISLAQSRASLPSGAPAEHRTVGEMLQKREKREEEKSRTGVFFIIFLLHFPMKRLAAIWGPRLWQWQEKE